MKVLIVEDSIDFAKPLLDFFKIDGHNTEHSDNLANAEAYLKVSKFDLSGHANRDELTAYAKKISPRAVILHHGDPEAREWFKQNLENEPFSIYDPEPLKTYDI